MFSLSSRVSQLVVVALGVCLIGCSKQDEKHAGGSGVNNPFVVDINQVGEIFDPTTILPSEVSAVAFNVYDWLFARNFDSSVKPGIAESWTMSPDAKELNIKLRKDVTFHDGTPMTSADVVFSWERIVKGGFSTRVSRSLEKIEAIDTHTVRITFGMPELGFVPFGGLAILSKAYFEKVGEQEFRAKPIGTGPYKIAGLTRGRHVDLERYDGYWGTKPEIKHARFQFVTEDSTRVAQLRAGEADMVMQVPFPLVGEIESDPKLKTKILSPGGMTVFLALKTDNPKSPWADPRVREAIALAIDHDAIVKDILRGYPKHYPFLAPHDIGYDPDIKPYPYDPARAQQLLKEAGVSNLQFDLPYIAGGVTGMKETAEAVALYLNKVGIKANAKPTEGPQFIKWVLQASKNPEMDYVAVFIGAVAGRSESSSGLLTHFSRVTPFAWYLNPEINGMALQMAGTPDEKARGELIRKMGQAVHQDMRYIPLWTNSHVYGMKRCVDFTPTLGSYDLMVLRDVSIAKCGAGASGN